MGVLYNWKQVKSYAKIGLYNLLHSVNKEKINDLDTFDIFLEPLKDIHNKNEVERFANELRKKGNNK